MAIVFTCPSCGNKLRVPDEVAGKRGKCPSCGVRVVVPEGSEALAPTPLPSVTAPAGRDVVQDRAPEKATTTGLLNRQIGDPGKWVVGCVFGGLAWLVFATSGPVSCEPAETGMRPVASDPAKPIEAVAPERAAKAAIVPMKVGIAGRTDIPYLGSLHETEFKAR